MRKKALKALIVLAAVTALCIFFSGTLHTITTAKVQLASPRTGRFETRVTLTGSLRWPEAEPVRAEGMGGEDALTVLRVPVTAGSWVRKGDLLAECAVTDYDARMAALRESSAAKEKELLELERKGAGTPLNAPEQEWYAAWKRLREAAGKTAACREELRLEAWKAGVAPDAEDRLPEGTADETLRTAAAALEQAKAEEAAARAAFERVSRFAMNEDVLAALEQKDRLREELDALSADMLALRKLAVSAAAVTAPRDGYLTAVDARAGEQLTAASAAAWITAEGTAPVIRLSPVSGLRSEAGTPVTLTVDGQTAESVLAGQGVEAGGGLYLDAALSRETLAALGGAAALTEPGAVTAVIVRRDEEPTTLVPASAVRGTEGAYYLYLVRREQNTLGAEKMTVVRRAVTVLGLSGATASVQEDLRGESIVYMEDRQLTEGCEVMLYGGA